MTSTAVRKLRSAARLPPADRLLFARGLLLAALAELAVRVLAPPRLAALFGVRLLDGGSEVSDPSRSGPLPAADTRQLERAVDLVFRNWPVDTCLRRALVLGGLLRSHDPVLKLGVRKDGAEVRAHAWIEVDGEPVGGPPGDYRPLQRHRVR